MAIENPPFIDDFPIKSSVWGFSLATFDYRRVTIVYRGFSPLFTEVYGDLMEL